MTKLRLYISTLLILFIFCTSKASAGVVTLDRTFNNVGYQLRTFDSFNSELAWGDKVAVQADGKIVVAGSVLTVSGPSDIGAMRFNPNGTLDTTFNGTGKVTTSMGPFENGRRVLIQPDGKILVTGDRYSGNTNNDFAAVRYLANGALDNSFDENGVVAPTVSGFSNEFSYDSFLLPDGKIVMVGTTAPTVTINENIPTDILIMRLNSDGSLDTSFNSSGKLIISFPNVSESANAVVVQNDGKIIIGGYLNNSVKNDFLLMRVNTNGTIDTNFGTNGSVVTSINSSNNAINALALQPDGQILAGGSATSGGAIVRYNSNGTIDASFGNNGIVTTTQAISNINIRTDGKFLIGGGINNRAAVSRYLSNGTIDVSFNNGGIFSSSVPTDNSCYARGMTIQNDGKILLSGYCSNNSSNQTQLSVFRVRELTTSIPYDFDGDGKTDIGIFRPTTGAWWLNASSTNVTTAVGFGASDDKLIPADYTGDGKTDIALFRPSSSQWFILRSEDFSFYGFQFGANGDIPAPGDFDGDGKTDVAVFRPSTASWYILRSLDGSVTSLQFGLPEDKPVIADYDGDGKSDIGIFRPTPAEWWILKSSGGVYSVQFGQTGDIAVAGDYTGDGKADVAFWRPSNGTWYILRSEDSSFYGFPFGNSSDTPTPGDYDGDGKMDAAVFRDSNASWYLLRSTAGFTGVAFGSSGDKPIPNSFVR